MCREHLATCEGCTDWLYNLLNDVLDSEDGLIIHLAYAKDFKNEEDAIIPEIGRASCRERV